MEMPEKTCVSFEGNIKAYGRLSQDSSSEDGLEKEALLENERAFLRRASPRLPAVPFLIHTLLILGNVSFCLLFFAWTVNRYSHGPNLRYSMMSMRSVMLSYAYFWFPSTR